MQTDDKNLICFFSWGRRDLVEKTFINLLESKRDQDRLLVIDQEMYNSDFYIKHKDKIDFLVFFKLNYDIGPVYGFIRNFVKWKFETKQVYDKVNIEGQNWYPDYINIVESDAIGKKGWIDRVLRVFKVNADITIASGYQASEHPTKAEIDGVLLKDITAGVQLMIPTNYFLKLFEILNTRNQDKHLCLLNNNIGKMAGILPGEIIHIGEGRRKDPTSL